MILAELNDSEYIAQREMQRPHISSPDFRVVKAADGKMYAVFHDEWAAYEFDLVHPNYFDSCSVACCGGYMNAYELGYPQ